MVHASRISTAWDHNSGVAERVVFVKSPALPGLTDLLGVLFGIQVVAGGKDEVLQLFAGSTAVIRREAARLVKFFDGIRSMDKHPGAMFVVDIKREHNAVAEARRLKIPVVAIVDTNCDPDLVAYPVAGNDDAIRSVRVILSTVGQMITQAQAEFEAKHRRKPAEEAPAPVEVPPNLVDVAAVAATAPAPVQQPSAGV